MSHALCDEPDCPCAQRAWAEAARKVFSMPPGALYKWLRKRAEGIVPSEKKKLEMAPEFEDAVLALRGLGVPANEARRKLEGTTGTTEERVRQALKE